MKLKVYAYFNNGKLKIDVLNKPIFYKSENIGRIINSKIEKDGSLFITIQINKNRSKEINKLLGNSSLHIAENL